MPTRNINISLSKF